jgi:glycosyltransferase involved in cell wall biosynthesis
MRGKPSPGCNGNAHAGLKACATAPLEASATSRRDACATSGLDACATSTQNRDSPLRIVIVNDVYDPRDRSADAVLARFTSLTGWARAIRDTGADVVVCQRFNRDAETTDRGVVYRFFAEEGSPKPQRCFGGVRAMHAAIAAVNPNVIHINGMDYPRAIRRLRTLLPAAGVIVQDHGGFEPQQLSIVRRAWLRRGLTVVDALLVSTAEQATEFRTSGLVPSTVAIRDVMESGTDLRVDLRPARTGPLSVLWVGRLNANKDPLTVLSGFAQFARTRSDTTLTFAYGTAELEPHLREAIDRDPFLRERVKLIGAVPHERIADLYAGADLFVLGSHREGSGYAALEAMACGVVPVLTNIPSFRGLTDAGRVGELWDVGSPQSLAAALSRAASGSLDAKRQACCARFETHFSWSAIGARAVEIYRECSAR